MLWRIKPNAKRIAEAISRQNIDLLYMNNQPGSNAEGYLAAEGLPITLVQHCRIEPVLNRELVGMVNQRADAIIAVSNGVREVLIAHGVVAEKCFTVFNAIDTWQPLPSRDAMRQQLLALDNRTFVFGSIGSLIPANPITIFCRRWKSLPRLPPGRLADGDPRRRPGRSGVKTSGAQAGIADRVIFTGFRPNALEYLAALDVFILASKSEGLPRVVLEAMLLNTAVIGSKVTGNR